MYSFYYLSVNDSSWSVRYPNLFDYAPVSSVRATLALMNQTGAVTNPTGQLLQIMENSYLADIRYQPVQRSLPAAEPLHLVPRNPDGIRRSYAGHAVRV